MTGFVGKIAVLSRRVFVLVLDGSLVPFCSKILVACMRANNDEKMETWFQSLSVDCLSADGPAITGRRSGIH